MKKYIPLLFAMGGIIIAAVMVREPTSVMDEPRNNCVNDIQRESIEIQTIDTNEEPRYIYLSKTPSRIFVCDGVLLNTLIPLGIGDRIIGASISNTASGLYENLKKEYPEEIKKIPHISSRLISREELISYQPDFVIGWKSAFSSHRFGSIRWWEERSIPSYIVATSNHVKKSATIEDECKFLDDMGRIFDVQEKTNAVIRDIYAELEIDWTDDRVKHQQDVMVVEVDGNEVMNYDEGWLVGDMVHRLGGRMPLQSESASVEEMIRQNPDVIFVVYFNERHRAQSEAFFRNVRLNSLRAVQNNRIYMIPFGYIYTPGLKTLEGLRAIKKGLYPTL